MKKLLPFAILLFFLSACGSAQLFGPSVTPSPTGTNTPTGTDTPTLTPTASSTFTPTLTPSLTWTPTQTPTPKLPVLQSTSMPGLAAAISLDNSAQVVQIARWGMGNVENVIFSPDGQHLAVPSSVGLYIFRVSDLAQENLIESLANVTNPVYTPDGASFLYASGDSIQVVDIASGQVTRTLSRKGTSIVSFALSPDGKVIALSFWDCSLRLWDVQTGKELLKILSVGVGGCQPVGRLSFSADGSTLAGSSYVYGKAGTTYGSLRVWDVASGKMRYVFPATTDAWNHDGAYALSPDGRLLAIRLDKLKIMDTVASKTLKQFDPQVISGTKLAFSPDGKSLTDGTGIWDTATWTKVINLAGAGVLSPDWKSSASFANSALTIRDAVSGSTFSLVSWTSFDVSNLSFTPDGMFLFSGARFWNLLTGQATSYPNTSGASRVAFSPEGGGTIAILSGQSVSLVNKSTGQVMHTADLPYGNFTDFFFSPNGKFLVAGERRGKAYTLDLTTWKVYNIGGEDNCLAISPDSKMLATGSSFYGMEGFITIMDPIKGYKDMFGSTNEPGISFITYSPDGKYLIVGSLEGDITIHRHDNGAVVKTFKAQGDYVSALIYSPDGKILASSSMDGTIKLWDASTWKLLVTLEGHQAGVSTLAFSPDGKMLVSGSEDGTIRFWGIVP